MTLIKSISGIRGTIGGKPMRQLQKLWNWIRKILIFGIQHLK